MVSEASWKGTIHPERGFIFFASVLTRTRRAWPPRNSKILQDSKDLVEDRHRQGRGSYKCKKRGITDLNNAKSNIYGSLLILVSTNLHGSKKVDDWWSLYWKEKSNLPIQTYRSGRYGHFLWVQQVYLKPGNSYRLFPFFLVKKKNLLGSTKSPFTHT